MDAKIQIRRLIELELRTAVAGDGIDVHFQPRPCEKMISYAGVARQR
jgi:hypothetical protein